MLQTYVVDRGAGAERRAQVVSKSRVGLFKNPSRFVTCGRVPWCLAVAGVVGPVNGLLHGVALVIGFRGRAPVF